MSKITSQVKILVLALALAVGISYVSAASTWTGPSTLPPGNNVDTPINVGSNAQTKSGDLGVNAFVASLGAFFGGNVTIGTTSAPARFTLVDGTQGANKVLVSDASGNASWGTVPSTAENPTTIFNNFSVSTGNNNSSFKIIGVLKPGTYTLFGRVTTTNDGGGGAASVFMATSSSLTSGQAYDMLICDGGVTGQTGASYKMYYNTDDSDVFFCLKRNGNNDDTFTIPSTTVTLTETKYLYIIGSQVKISGFIAN